MITTRFALILSTTLAIVACEGPSPDEGDEVQSELLARRIGRGHRDAGRCRDSAVPAPAPTCLFGEQFSDLRTNPALVIESEVWITSAAELAELEAAQLVLAVQQSSHTDVTTAAEALARVDQQEVRRMEIAQTDGARAFTVYEYGVGDNSYGAIFGAGTTELAASIHDGDLLGCNVYTDS